MTSFINPLFNLSATQLLVIAIAITIVGIAKGGFGGTFAMLGVPIISLVMPSLQAAAILLPILIIMDIISLRLWWKQWDTKILRLMIPPAVLGIGFGWLLADRLNEDTLRLLLGFLAIIFVMKESFWNKSMPMKPSHGAASFWGMLSGFTSFIAHAGGPAFQIHVQPMKLAPSTYAATAVFFFAAMNFVKLIPYFALGQFDHTNLVISFSAFPLAMLATWAGKVIVKKVDAEIFYPLLNIALLIVGIYLVKDGINF